MVDFIFEILDFRFEIMSTIRKFEDLEIWQIAQKLSVKIFHLTEVGPASKDFRFRDQIRDSA